MRLANGLSIVWVDKPYFYSIKKTLNSIDTAQYSMIIIVNPFKSPIPCLGYYANSADPFQTLPDAASELGLHFCLQDF